MDKLNQGEQEMLLRWFEQHMTMEQRHRLMAEMPVFYAKLIGNGSEQMAGVLSEFVRAAVAPSPDPAIDAARKARAARQATERATGRIREVSAPVDHCGDGTPHRPHDYLGVRCSGTTLDEAEAEEADAWARREEAAEAAERAAEVEA